MAVVPSLYNLTCASIIKHDKVIISLSYHGVSEVCSKVLEDLLIITSFLLERTANDLKVTCEYDSKSKSLLFA
ncbi:MAG: hypothetical protein K1060chlam5_00817 [Candidatus Anoxychlamydiales bacterium]|nr:hypothetical protein [Candidatus Anoxychlamydiales bacterium]